MNNAEETKFEKWAIIELMGRNMIAGFVTEQVIGGSAMFAWMYQGRQTRQHSQSSLAALPSMPSRQPHKRLQLPQHRS